MLIIDTVSTCFGHLYAHLQEKDTCYCMWSVFSVTRKDADISRVVFYGDSVWFDNKCLSPEDGHKDARNMLRQCQ